MRTWLHLITMVMFAVYGCAEAVNADGTNMSAIVAIGQTGTNALVGAQGTGRQQQEKKVHRRSFSGLSEREMWKAKPRMAKFRGAPQTEEEYLTEDWYRAMGKVDRNFERKMPIEFYGMIVDQYTNPVADAAVSLSWAATWDNEEKSIQSDANGRFSIKGIRGRLLNVSVYKNGYRGAAKARQTFEYADFHEHDFHIPDSANPVVFTLWKYENPEPMFLLTKYNVVLPMDDRVVWMDIEQGAQIAETGQVGFGLLRTNPTNWLAGYTITIHAATGGGVKLSVPDDELMFTAPENGYQPQIRIEQPPGDHFAAGKKLRFYLRTSDGKYAAVKIQVNQYNNPQSGSALESIIYFNPSGSRNLQYRDDLQIHEKPKPIDNG